MHRETAASVKGLLAESQLSSPIDLEAAFSDSLEGEDESALLSPSSELISSAEGDGSEAGGSRPARNELGGPQAEIDARMQQEAIETLQQENLALRRAAAGAEAKAASDIRSYKTTVESAQVATREELHQLRSVLASLRSELPVLQEKLAVSKEEFGSLRISAERYETLAALPPERLTLVEFVQLRAHELVKEVEAPIEQLRHQQQASLLAQSGAAAQLHAEGAARLAAETELRQCKVELEELRHQLHVSRHEVARLKAAEAAATPLGSGMDHSADAEATALAAEAQAAAAAAQVELARVQQEAARVSADALQREEMLRLDKEFLGRQLETSKERLALVEAEVTKKDGLLLELKAEKDAMYDKLLAVTSGAQEAYAARLEGEMSKWQQQAAASQATLRDAHERQLEQLRDARELALADADKWHTRYAEVKRQYDEQLLSSSQQLAEAEVQLATARSELKLKTFEAERLSLQCEQSIASARRDELATDAAREKFELLKTEYYTLQSRSVEKVAELEARHTSALEKLRAYEELEAELDKSVLQADVTTAATAAPTTGGGGASGSTLLVPSMPALRVPSSSQRRLEQCLALSRELLAAQRAADALRAKLAERNADVERMREQLGDAQRRLKLAAQPQAFLAEQLQLSERQVHQQQRRLEAASAAHSELQEALGRSQLQQRMLKADLERVLQQRGSLDALRTTLARLL